MRSMSSVKTIDIKRGAFFSLLLLLLIAAVVCLGLYLESWHNLVQKQEQPRVTSTVNGVKGLAPMASSDTVPRLKSDALALLSDDTRERILSSFPFTTDLYVDVRELSPDTILALVGKDHASAWILDLKQTLLRRVSEEIDLGHGNHIGLLDWSQGVAIERFFSPGEAVGTVQRTYLDATGAILAETSHGTFDRESGGMDARIGARAFQVALVQKNPCQLGEMDLDQEFYTTTTITGLTVNGKLFPLPTQIAIPCESAYGGGAVDPTFPSPSFDGKRITFSLPGYEMALTSAGMMVYTPKVSYTIPCLLETGASLALIREDQTGSHVVQTNVLDQLPLSEMQAGGTCFEPLVFDGMRASFLVQRFEKSTQRFHPIATVDYHAEKNSFEHLQYFNGGPLGSMHFVSDAPALPCEATWYHSLQRLLHGDASVVSFFEHCAQARKYPFQRHDIPGRTGAYIGFIGNDYSRQESVPGPICQIDAPYQGCLVYRMEDGELTVFKNEEAMLLQKQILGAASGQEVIIRQFPSRPCFSYLYGIYDVVTNTSTATIIRFDQEGSCTDETTLTLFPLKDRSIVITLRPTSIDIGHTEWELLYNDKRLGLIQANLGAWRDSPLAFPREEDLARYATQSDRSRFFFSAGGTPYTLDMSVSPPVLRNK